ncbi:TorF family putative porin [Methylophaga sp.]|mgnify:FL=1|uniref:TorF family putative porin n=1 Tax=Methylophaga sp. TaxID=2024840 RepID=UPI003A918D8D
MKLRTISALTLAASTMLAASSAMAWESEDGQHSTSATVGLFSDYLFRGISFTDEDPAIQGSFDYAHASGLYAGVWASNLSTADDSSIEIDGYVGYGNVFGDSGVGYDVSVVRYFYPGSSDSDTDYNEYFASLSYSYFTAMVGYTPEWGGDDDIDEIYYNLSFDYELPYGIALNAAVGYTDSDRNDGDSSLSDSYVDYTIGLSKPFVGFDWSIAYVGTDSDGDDFAGSDSAADDRFLVSVSKSF